MNGNLCVKLYMRSTILSINTTTTFKLIGCARANVGHGQSIDLMEVGTNWELLNSSGSMILDSERAKALSTKYTRTCVCCLLFVFYMRSFKIGLGFV